MGILNKLGGARAAQPQPGTLAVGIDVGLRRIKLAVLSAAAGRVDLVWSLDVPTPAGIVGSDGSFDSAVAGRVLLQLFGGSPLAGAARGAIVLPSSALRVRRLQAVTLDPASLARVLAEDSELRVPGIAPEGLHRSWTPIGDTPARPDGDGKRSLVVAAARRDAITAYGSAAAGAGIVPRVSAPAVALANLHARLCPEETGAPMLLLHLGSVRSDLVVVHEGAPVLALPIMVGTDHLFERLRGLVRGLASEPEKALRNAGDNPEVVREIDEWASRIQGSHRTALGAAEQRLRAGLDQLPVRVSGGAARLPLVVERLSAAIADGVDVLDPADAFGGPAGAATPALVLALGAALEAEAAGAESDGGGGRPLLLDLALPEQPRARASLRQAAVALGRDRRVWAAVAAAVLLGVGVPAALRSHLSAADAEVAAARAAYRQEATVVAADSARIAALQADSARLAGTLGTLARLEQDRYALPRFMDAAARALPPYAWIETLTMESGAPGTGTRISIGGIAPVQADVSRYERSLLDGGGDVTDVRLAESRSLQSGPFALVGFTLEGSFGETDRSRPERAGYHPTEQPVPVSHTLP